MALAGIKLQFKTVVFFFPNHNLTFDYLVYHFDIIKKMAPN